MADIIIYASLSNPYAQIIEVSTGKVWDVTNGVLAAAPTYTDTAITMTVNSYYNGYPITMPATLPKGVFDLIIKENASPANSDSTTIGKAFRWNGNSTIPVPMKFREK